MSDIFLRVKNILGRLRDVLKCQKCFQLKQQDKVIFYRVCDHFFCLECIENEELCPLCENSSSKPIYIVNDKNMLSLYQSLLKLELPSKNDIKLIYENCKESKKNANQFDKGKNSKKEGSKSVNVLNATGEKSTKDLISDQESNLNLSKSITDARKGKKKKKKEKEMLTKAKADSVSFSNFVEKNTKKNKSELNKVENSVCVTKNNNASLNLNNTQVLDEKIKNYNFNQISSGKSLKLISKLDVNKKNAKGETQLHIACRKINYSKVKELIEAGADLNEPDNAGWTPLHEAVFTGKAEIVKFLLENKAKVNMPGSDNSTALHEAVAHSKTEILKLLLEYGANIYATNIFRETPLDLAEKYDFTEAKEILLAWTPVKPEIMANEDMKEPLTNAILYKHNLPIDEEKLINKFAEKFGLEMASSMTKQNKPTHIIVSNERFDITWGVLSSILNGCWLVSVDWVKNCMEEEVLKSAVSYQLKNEKFSGFIKSRINKNNKFPGLFCGCHFFFGGGIKTYEVKNITVSTNDLQSVVEKNGGKIIKRSPDPESLTLEKTVPYHTDPSGSLKETAYYIIHQNKKWVPPLVYKMPHVKGLPIEWLLASIFHFELIDPTKCEHLESFL